jgi:hypothetical protein
MWSFNSSGFSSCWAREERKEKDRKARISRRILFLWQYMGKINSGYKLLKIIM